MGSSDVVYVDKRRGSKNQSLGNPSDQLMCFGYLPSPGHLERPMREVWILPPHWGDRRRKWVWAVDLVGWRSLQSVCKSHNLHYITSSKDSEKGILPLTTVCKHNLPCNLRMPTKFISSKKEAMCEHGPEAPSCPVGQGSFKRDRIKVEKCYVVRGVQIWYSCWK